MGISGLNFIITKDLINELLKENGSKEKALQSLYKTIEEQSPSAIIYISDNGGRILAEKNIYGNLIWSKKLENIVLWPI